MSHILVDLSACTGHHLPTLGPTERQRLSVARKTGGLIDFIAHPFREYPNERWDRFARVFYWIVGVGIAAVFVYGTWLDYSHTIVRSVMVTLTLIGYFLGTNWKIIVAVALVLWIVRELRSLRYMLCRVYDQLDPISRHFQRLEKEEHEAGVRELERQLYSEVQADMEKRRSGAG